MASAAGFDSFAYWGYSWGAAVGLQLAARTQRITALVLGGWPPLGAPYDAILQATRLKQSDPEPSSLKVLRSPAQYTQWIHYGQSIAGWHEREAVARVHDWRFAVDTLLAWLLTPDELSSVQTRIASGETQQYRLQHPAPLLIAYWTVEASKDGALRYYPDIYTRDMRLVKALAPNVH